MKIINFSWNWNNKLFCRFHSTIRLRNDNKYVIGEEYREQLNDKDIGTVFIREISHFKISQLNANMAGIDTGYNVAETKKLLGNMYPKVNWNTQYLSFILLENPKRKGVQLPDEFFINVAEVPA